MEFSPYLKALQSIKGRTPGHKYRTLRRIAIRIADEHILTDVSRPIRIFPSNELPRELIPWVKLEVADMLKKPEEIAVALLSEDFKIFNRALKVKWYFTTNLENYSDINFFMNQLFPKICLVNRLKIIRALGQYLRPYPELAEEFYTPISVQYGYDVARPILMACGKDFLWKQLFNYRIILNLGEIKYLYNKYSSLVIDYLRKSVREDFIGRPIHEIYLDKYKDFLPVLVKKHPQQFIEFIQRSSNMDIRLSGKKTKLLLKVGIDAIVRNPEIFLPMLTPKDVSRQLQLSHYVLLLKKFFNSNFTTLDFEEIKEYFEYVPVQHLPSVITSICEEKYGKNWLENYKKITPLLLRLLSRNNRILLARKKLAADREWYIESNSENIEKSWWCYLSIEESIPIIKAAIFWCLRVPFRMILMRQMLLTCEINDDPEALHSVFLFFSSQFTHSVVNYTKQEEWDLMDLFLSSINRNSPSLEQKHWDVINGCIWVLKYRQGTVRNEQTVIKILIKGIEFDLINNIQKKFIKEKINLLTAIYQKKPQLMNWNILQNDARYEKLCLEEFAQSILIKFRRHYEENTYQWRKVCVTFMQAIYDYNHRHKKSKRIKKKLSIKRLPWLVETIQQLWEQLSTRLIPENSQIISFTKLDDLLRCNEPRFLPSESAKAYRKKIKFFKWTELQSLFHSSPEIHNYERHYRECRDNIYKKSIQKFLRFCRWHKDIPIRFVELALVDLNKEERNYNALIVLSILVEGSVFNRFITPLIPEQTRATSSTLLLNATVESMKHVNPAMSLNLIRIICDLGMDEFTKSLLLILRARIGANRVIPFCSYLTHRFVHLFHYIMNTVRIVAKLDDIVPILDYCWQELNQNYDDDDTDDKNKRYQLLRNMLIVFETKACPKIWNLVNKWLNDLNVKDEPRTCYILNLFEHVPVHWLGEYFEKVITTIRRLDKASSIDGHWRKWYRIAPLIDFPPDATVILSDDDHEYLIIAYCNVAFTNQSLLVLNIQLINSYILSANDSNQVNRLSFFSDIFRQILEAHENLEQPTNELGCTIRDFLNEFAELLIFNTNYSPMKNMFIEEALRCYMTLLTPQYHPLFYCYFFFASFYDNRTTAFQFIDRVYNSSRLLYELFRMPQTHLVGKVLHRVMKHLYRHQVPDMILRVVRRYERASYYLAACWFFDNRRQLCLVKFYQIFGNQRSDQDDFIIARILKILKVLVRKRDLILPL